MNFTDLFSSKIENASQTISSINCFGEYIASKFTDLANFMSGIGEYASTYFSVSGDTVQNKLACITRTVYDHACESPDQTFTVPVRFASETNDGDEVITVTGQDITDAFEQQLSELRCQEQYITYCLNAENCTATEFITRMRSLCPNIAGAVIEKFSGLIEISGSPVDCIKNYLSMFKGDSITYDNQIIALVNYNDYSGNIWQSAWQVVTDQVTSFFEGVWQGIKDISGFFERLTGAVTKLGKWIVSKAFRELSTSYDKASSAAAGIMDLPLFQIYGSATDWASLIWTVNHNNLVGYSVDGYNHKLDYSDDGIFSAFMPSLAHLMRDVFDGVSYDSVCEVVVPSSPYDLSLRLGKTASKQIVLSAYVVSDYGSWSAYEDSQQIARVRESLKNAFGFISQLCPMSITPQSDQYPLQRFNAIMSLFLNNADNDFTDLFDWLVVKSMSVNDIVQATSQHQLAVTSMTLYMMLMSKGFVNTDLEDITSSILMSSLFNPIKNTYTLTSEQLQFMDEIDPAAFDIALLGASFFRPYAKRNQLPVTIHYQTSSERGLEIINAFLKVVIAVVAVVATIKLTKWSKRRQQNTLLAHANVDRLAWDVASNPSQDNLNSFTKAWKKARRMDFVNGILGLSTGSGTDTMSSVLGTISNIVGVNTKDSADAVATTQTVNREVQNANTSLTAIRSLIKNN